MTEERGKEEEKRSKKTKMAREREEEIDMDDDTSENEKKDEDEKLFERLNKRLETLAAAHKKSFNEVFTLFGKVSGNIVELERFLRGEEVPVFTELEDITLKQNKPSTKMFKQVKEDKGDDAIQNRIRFMA